MIINLTPHNVQVYSAEAFENLEKTNPTTWIADNVSGEGQAFPSQGVARVKVATVEASPIEGIPTVTSSYGEIEGLPDFQEGTFYIVSLPTVSAAIANGRTTADLLTPYQVVRSRSNGSLVLGCMGLARQ